MLAYLINRLAQLIPVLIGCSLLVFLALQFLPGDAAQAFLGEREFNQEDYKAMREYLGLDEPLYAQYYKYVKNILHGDFGRSVRTSREKSPVPEARSRTTANSGSVARSTPCRFQCLSMP